VDQKIGKEKASKLMRGDGASNMGLKMNQEEKWWIHSSLQRLIKGAKYVNKLRDRKGVL